MTSETRPLMRTEDWCLASHATYRMLPIHVPSDDKRSTTVKNVVFSQAMPTPLENAQLVCTSKNVLVDLLDLQPDAMIEDPAFTDLVAGKKMPRGANPVAHRYGGHQYGIWVGQLGDGRAHMLGEYLNRRGERWQLQLKGSGRTPYSRDLDGRCTLRSSIREMIASEACHALGIPTTRAAALAASDACVKRPYGHKKWQEERIASLLRLAPCWYRFGSLEILARSEEFLVLRHLCDFIIKEHFRHIMLSDEGCYLLLFSEIAMKSLKLVAKWQALGFAHGLLNTDNMSVLGITLDFGPFGFLDCYDGEFIANSSDAGGNYAFKKQPEIMLYILGQLACSLRHLMPESHQAHLTKIVGTLDIVCKNNILEHYVRKLGLASERWGDEQLVEKLLDMMQSTGADFTATFRQLAELDPSELLNASALERTWSVKRLATHSAWSLWVDSYRERLVDEAAERAGVDMGAAASETPVSCTFEEERRRRMRRVNPVYVPRNWMLHEAVQDANNNDYDKVKFLLKVFQDPFEVQPEAESRGFSAPPPLWAHYLKVDCTS